MEVLPSGDGFVVGALDENSTAPIRVYVNWTRLLDGSRGSGRSSAR